MNEKGEYKIFKIKLKQLKENIKHKSSLIKRNIEQLNFAKSENLRDILIESTGRYIQHLVFDIITKDEIKYRLKNKTLLTFDVDKFKSLSETSRKKELEQDIRKKLQIPDFIPLNYK